MAVDQKPRPAREGVWKRREGARGPRGYEPQVLGSPMKSSPAPNTNSVPPGKTAQEILELHGDLPIGAVTSANRNPTGLPSPVLFEAELNLPRRLPHPPPYPCPGREGEDGVSPQSGAMLSSDRLLGASSWEGDVLLETLSSPPSSQASLATGLPGGAAGGTFGLSWRVPPGLAPGAWEKGFRKFLR